ncbi:MAG TPA: radical SAM protein [Desulfosalsimonadaceae bacterium]|nr:radical SAM protein [Desulfosalsimonadaceae bacterium]
MSWQIVAKIDEILKKGADFVGIDRDDAIELMHLDLHSREVYALMQTANQMTRQQFQSKGENHFHIGLNVEPCPFNCSFCSLTETAGIFTENIEFPIEEVLDWAKIGEENQADALNIMTTGTYPFKKLLEVGRILKDTVSVPLVANTRDMTHKEGEQLLDAGFVGAYHAVRLGEGKDTPFIVRKRIQTIQVLKDVGLCWMNCVEPVGPEHAIEEIVDLMFLARKHGATYSGVMRRINFPGSPMEKYGMITELEMARMVAVSRLVMGDVPKAHCTHEPHTASLMAGANLFFPEVGSNPRDGASQVEGGRGKSLLMTQQIHREMGMDPMRPSNCFEGIGQAEENAL